MAKDQRPDFIIISWETAEYLSILGGQVNWGNQKRRAAANSEIGIAMEGHQMTTSLDCFTDQSKKNK
jgi:hypothetical protein